MTNQQADVQPAQEQAAFNLRTAAKYVGVSPATIAMLMHAYDAHVTPAQLMAIEKRSEAPYGFWITPNRKLKIGPFSFN